MSVNGKARDWLAPTAAAILFLVAPCAEAASVTVGINVFPRTLDPTFDTSAQAQGVYRMIYEPLITIGEGGRVNPWLAQSCTGPFTFVRWTKESVIHRCLPDV